MILNILFDVTVVLIAFFIIGIIHAIANDS